MPKIDNPPRDEGFAEPLTKEQQAELRADLERLRQELDEQLDASKQGSEPVVLDQQSVGRLSRMDAMQHQQIAVASRRELSARRQLVQTALAAMQRDDYGTCRRCEEPIGYARLKVKPEAPFCVRCQGKRESQR